MYGCHNKPRPTAETQYLAQNGWNDSGRSWARVVAIKHTMSTACQYDKSATDSRCLECAHATTVVDRAAEGVTMADPWKSCCRHCGALTKYEAKGGMAVPVRCECLAATRPAAPVQAAPEGFVLALQTVVTMPNGKKELGYTVLDGIGIFASAQEVHEAIAELSLPLGWVSMTTRQLLPGWMAPAAPAPGESK